VGGADLPIELVLSLSAQVPMRLYDHVEEDSRTFPSLYEGSENPDSSKLIILLLAF